MKNRDVQAVFVRAEQVWEGRLAEYISELCDFKDSYAGSKPCSEVLHKVEFHQQG